MAETWVLNATISFPSSVLSGTFTSGGNSYNSIAPADPQLYYRANETVKSVYIEGSGWIHNVYRTLVFDTSPTGAMLTWLQANGVKQSDPEPETPTNSCMIDGTVYGIKTGQTLIGGTAQTIYNGRTLVAGAGYDIVLSSSGFTVTITGSGNNSTSGAVRVYVVINGISYTSPAALTVEKGTTITAYAKSTSITSAINVNGVKVQSGADISYEYTVNENTNVNLKIRGNSNFGTAIITITTS